MSWLALLWACSSRPDPALAPLHDAVVAWDEGIALLDKGDAAGARERFAIARTHRPGDVLLAAWEAKALADLGQLDEAIARMDDVLAAAPGFAEARYNRAAWRVRRGDHLEEGGVTEIADELHRAIAEGAASSRAVLDDPDFAELVGRPEFDFLPEEPLTVAVEAPEGTVFWGSEFAVRFRIAGAGDGPIGVTAENVQGPLQLVSVIDDRNPSTQGTFRDLTWTFRVLGAGDVLLGPFHAWTGDLRTVIDPISLTAAAPEGKVAPDPLPAYDFQTPSERAGRALAPSARVDDDGLSIMYVPGDRVVIDPPLAGEPVRYELRERSRTRWTLDHYRGAGTDGVRVKVMRGGYAVFDEAVARDGQAG